MEPRTRGRRMSAAGFVLLALSVGLYCWFAHVPGDHGWTHRRWADASFDGAPTETGLVTEPFERDVASQPYAAEWQTWLRIDECRTYEFAVEADDAAELLVAGQRVVHATGVRARKMHSGRVRLESGIHPVTLRVVDQGGGKYVRLFFNTPEAEHGWMPVPFPRRMAWPTLEDVQVAAPSRAMCLFLTALLARLVFGLVFAVPLQKESLAEFWQPSKGRGNVATKTSESRYQSCLDVGCRVCCGVLAESTCGNCGRAGRILIGYRSRRVH